MNGGQELLKRVRATRLPWPGARRRIRRRAGLRLREVAAALGVHPMTVLRWQRGQVPRPEHAVAYRRHLDALEAERR